MLNSEQSFRFHVVNMQGERVAAAEYIEEATLILRLLPSGDRVVEPTTMITYAYKRRHMARKLRALGVA